MTPLKDNQMQWAIAVVVTIIWFVAMWRLVEWLTAV